MRQGWGLFGGICGYLLALAGQVRTGDAACMDGTHGAAERLRECVADGCVEHVLADRCVEAGWVVWG